MIFWGEKKKGGFGLILSTGRCHPGADGPAGVTVRALPSANVTRGSGFTVDCGAEAVPAPTYTWALPPAPNLRLAADNRSVTVTRATTANRGVYTCTASNRHGRRAGSVVVRVDGEMGTEGRHRGGDAVTGGG